MKTRKSPGNSDCDGTRTKQVAAGERTFKGRWRLRAHVQRNVPFGRTFTEVTILPLMLSLGGPAVAPVNTEAAPPVTADAEAPFSCSSPLLFVRLFLFPLLLFWLGIMVRSVWMQPATEHLCGYHVEGAWRIWMHGGCRCYSSIIILQICAGSLDSRGTPWRRRAPLLFWFLLWRENVPLAPPPSLIQTRSLELLIAHT